MAYKNLNLLFIILILLVVNGLDGQKFIPGPREGHTATLLGGKIYYIGGVSMIGEVRIDLSAADFFYLDEKFTWVDLKSQGAKFPVTLFHTSDMGGANQDSIFIIGGFQTDNKSSIYKFNTKTNEINIPVIQDVTPPRRKDMRSVSYGGKIYIFSGRNYNNTYSDRFDILDTVNMKWQVGSLVNVPPPRCLYTATLVNGVIYYIGGTRLDETYFLMSDIYQYDIIGNTWTFKKATAARTLPRERIGHSAVLVNGKICIYGGTYLPASAKPMSSDEQIAMLDTTTLAWSIPQLQNPNIPSLVHHTATLIDKQRMLIAFGVITNLSGGPVNNDKFYLFDFDEQNITWNGFTAQEIGNAKPISPTGSASPGKTEDSSPSSSPSKAMIIGLSVGLVVVGLAGIVGLALVYKHMRKNKKNAADGESGDITNSSKFAPTTSQYQYSNSQEGSRTSTLT